MNDNEIIKALECCIDCKCKECPCYKNIDGEMRCTEIDEEEILNLINRKKAEIERLQNQLKEGIDLSDSVLKIVKTEAYKEFAERLTNRICEKLDRSLGNHNGNNYFITDVYEDIDELVKEMAGE